MPHSEITLPDEFASTMQQLVAEAEKAIAPAHTSLVDDQEMRGEFALLNERISSLERACTEAVESVAATIPRDLNAQMQKMDEHLMALRNTESVNHRLFNSLHQELKDYRDNLLRDTLQKPFIRDLVVLLDDLTALSQQMSSGGGGGREGSMMQWSANLENAIHSLLEILHRMEVTEIEPKETVERALHRVVSFEPSDFAEEEGRIVMRVKRGFMWRGQVLRPEEVVAKRFA
jgi:molecular chaperone GrpE (heat shock protein)